MFEITVDLFYFGQQLVQQSQEQPSVCFAAVPLLVPAAFIAFRALARSLAGSGGTSPG